MLTMIGLARKYPITNPCAPVSTALKANAATSAPARPIGRLAMNTIVVTLRVAPRQNDMTLPDSVMKVIPTATQPMNDMVVASENRLVAVRKPGVAAAAVTSASTAATRTAASTRLRGDVGSRRRSVRESEVMSTSRVPRAVQRHSRRAASAFCGGRRPPLAVHRRCGTPVCLPKETGVPGLQRTTSLRSCCAAPGKRSRRLPRRMRDVGDDARHGGVRARIGADLAAAVHGDHDVAEADDLFQIA